MNVEAFAAADLAVLPEFQPPTWGDLGPRFEYFIKHPFCAPLKLTQNGQTVAIGTSISHRDTVWLACIIVHPEHRNQGLGAYITQALIERIDRNAFKTIYLDATDLGYPVYKKLGFELETLYEHLKTETHFPEFQISSAIFPFREDFRESAYALDQSISGEDRSVMLAQHLLEGKYFFENGSLLGFWLPTWSDGPIIANHANAGIALMKLRLQHNPVAILPTGNRPAIGFLLENGLSRYRTSRRMFLGERRSWNDQGVYNRISGQLG